MAFNELFNKESGVRRVDNVFSQNIMLAYGTGYDAKPNDNPQQEQIFADSGFDEPNNSDTFLHDLADQRDNSTSLMETLRPDKSYKPPEIKNDLTRDAGKVVTDGNKVSKQAAGGMEAVQSQKAAFKTDFKQAKSEVTEMLKDVAKDMGFDPDDVVDQMMAKGDSSNLGMLAGAGASVAMGPVGAVVAGGQTIRQELSKKEQQLPVKDQQAIMKEMLTRLKTSRAAPDSREEASARGKMDAGAAEDSPKKSENAWEDAEIEDVAALMVADLDGSGQPELVALLEVEHKLKEALDNHAGVKANYAGQGDLVGKISNSLESGNDAMASLVAEGQVVKIDAGAARLGGDSVRGVEGGVTVASVSGIDTGSIAKDLNLDLMNEPAIKEQLHGDINAQFTV